MSESTITAKGRTTVPADIRAHVNAGPGTRLVWSVLPDATIILRTKAKSAAGAAGQFKLTNSKHPSVARLRGLLSGMNTAIEPDD